MSGKSWQGWDVSSWYRHWRALLNIRNLFLSLGYCVLVIFLKGLGLERKHLKDHHPWNFEGFICIFPLMLICIFKIFDNIFNLKNQKRKTIILKKTSTGCKMSLFRLWLLRGLPLMTEKIPFLATQFVNSRTKIWIQVCISSKAYSFFPDNNKYWINKISLGLLYNLWNTSEKGEE